MILPADKGRATVILDTDTYKTKLRALLNDRDTYEELDENPTSDYKGKDRYTDLSHHIPHIGKCPTFLWSPQNS